MWNFILPLLASGLLGGIGSAITGGAQRAKDRDVARKAEAQRQFTERDIANILNPNYSGIEAAARQYYDASSKSLASDFAGRGLSNQPIQSGTQASLMADVLSNLSQSVAADKTDRQKFASQLRQQEAYGVPDESSITGNGFGDFAGGFAGGALGALPSSIAGFTADNSNKDLLKLLGGMPAQTFNASASNSFNRATPNPETYGLTNSLVPINNTATVEYTKPATQGQFSPELMSLIMRLFQ